MLLRNTAELLTQKRENSDFDFYAVLVGKNGEETFLHSDNVDEDTCFDIVSMGKILVTTPLILKAVGEKKLSFDHTPLPCSLKRYLRRRKISP